MDSIKLSLIISIRNGGTDLKEMLELLSMQTLSQKKFEVIIVDNGSSEATQSIIKDYSGRFLHFQNCIEPETGLMEARHHGLRKARADLLTFCDDNIIPFATWLEGVVEAFEDPAAALVTGNNFPYYQDIPPKWLEYTFVKNSYGFASRCFDVFDFNVYPKEIGYEYVWNCNFSIRKDILLKAGGFHPDAVPSDQYEYAGDGESHIARCLERKSGLHAKFYPKASVWHKISTAQMTLEYAARRHFLQGISDSYTDFREERVYVMDENKNSSICSFSDALKMPEISFLLAKANDISREEFQACMDQMHSFGYQWHRRKLLENVNLLYHVIRADYLCSPEEDDNEKRSSCLKYLMNKNTESHQKNIKLTERNQYLEKISLQCGKTEQLISELARSRALYVWSRLMILNSRANVYLFGAGQHTQWFLNQLIEQSLPLPAAIIDDNPSKDMIAGVPVKNTGLIDRCDSSHCIVLSSDIWQEKMMDRCRTLFPDLTVINLYEGLPPGPYMKDRFDVSE